MTQDAEQKIVLSFFIFIMSLTGLLIIGIDFPLATAALSSEPGAKAAAFFAGIVILS